MKKFTAMIAQRAGRAARRQMACYKRRAPLVVPPGARPVRALPNLPADRPSSVLSVVPA